eukprot:scaffold237_cov421-Prasinococcus_capsulatus_cf.AAC.17
MFAVVVNLVKSSGISSVSGHVSSFCTAHNRYEQTKGRLNRVRGTAKKSSGTPYLLQTLEKFLPVNKTFFLDAVQQNVCVFVRVHHTATGTTDPPTRWVSAATHVFLLLVSPSAATGLHQPRAR